MPIPSRRVRDINGFIEVIDNPISKAGVFDYSGAQLGLVGPDAARIFRVYRPAEELAAPECLASFRLLPFINDHPASVLGEQGTPAEAHGVEGFIGEQIRFEPPYLLANLRIVSQSLQRAIGAGKIELSPGYRCRYELAPGVTPDGEQYDAVQRDIRGNHLALVDEGRTGPDVAVLDHLKITLDAKEIGMPDAPKDPTLDADPLEQAKALIAQLAPMLQASTEIRAMLGELVGATEPQPPAPVVDEPPAALPPAAPALDLPAALDAALAKHLGPLSQRLDALEAGRAALDAAVLSGIADRDALAARLAPFIGAFDAKRMTAQQVAEYGVEKLGLKPPKGSEAVALDAYLMGRVPDAQRPTVAADGKPADVFANWGKK